MELVNIYQDDNMKVDLPQQFVEYFNYKINCGFQLSSLEMEDVLDEILEYLEANGVNVKGKYIITSAHIPYINRGKSIEVTEKYQDIQEALSILNECFNNTQNKVDNNWTQNIELFVKLYYNLYKQQKCILHFFEKEKHKVSGFCSLIKADKLLILPFNLNDEGIYYTI